MYWTRWCRGFSTSQLWRALACASSSTRKVQNQKMSLPSFVLYIPCLTSPRIYHEGFGPIFGRSFSYSAENIFSLITRHHVTPLSPQKYLYSLNPQLTAEDSEGTVGEPTCSL
jgi:hypothetical protein